MPTLHWFWSAFWPNVAATLIGVVLGVPIALYLNTLAGKAAHARANEEGAVRLRNALLSLVSAIGHNEVKLSAVQASLQHSQVVFELGVDTAAWEATKSQVTENLNNPDLHRRMALHHSNLQNLSRLYVMYFDMVTGIASALGGIEVMRESLRNFLLARSGQLLEEAVSLKAELMALTRDAKAA